MEAPRRHPTEEECRALWEKYETPEHIRKHCLAVAEVAAAVGRKLVEFGCDLDLELIRAAGLIHDVVRLSGDHEKEGAEIMRGLGYEREAEIVEVHMHYDPFSPLEEVTETDIVCLGDRTVIEHRFAGVESRYRYIADKAIRMGRPEAEDFIMEKKLDALRFTDEIRRLTGMTLEEIAGDIEIE